MDYLLIICLISKEVFISDSYCTFYFIVFLKVKHEIKFKYFSFYINFLCSKCFSLNYINIDWNCNTSCKLLQVKFIASVKNSLSGRFGDFQPRGCLRKTLPVTDWLFHYKWKEDFFGDVVAGVTVAIMHIPQGTNLRLWKINWTISFFIQNSSTLINVCFFF